MSAPTWCGCGRPTKDAGRGRPPARSPGGLTVRRFGGRQSGGGCSRHQSHEKQGRTRAMKLPSQFYKPLAIGAPQPVRELPVRPERMIHFFPPHIEKIRARVPEMARQVDVLLGNLEDAIPADAKEAARTGFIDVTKATDFGDTALWARINSLNSPWALDDVLEIVAAVGNKLDVIMLPKVDGPWDIHYLDQLLAQLEAK